jgi:hypothetical protein
MTTGAYFSPVVGTKTLFFFCVVRNVLVTPSIVYSVLGREEVLE